jgi:hypothetical protein
MPRHLKPGDSETLKVTSKKKWNRSDLLLERGCTYRFEARGEWVDLNKPCGPAGYESDSVLLRWTECCRRMPKEKWFALIGAFDCRDSTAFALGEACITEVQESGILTCFANDLWFMYWNNHGSVRLTVTRLT